MIENKPIIPDDPLEFITRCVNQRKIKWTYHVNMRMKKRFITRQLILGSSANFEIIEEYPEDKYLPSYLVYSQYQNQAFHIMFASDVQGDNVRVITAYYPNSEEWKEDLKTRR